MCKCQQSMIFLCYPWSEMNCQILRARPLYFEKSHILKCVNFETKLKLKKVIKVIKSLALLLGLTSQNELILYTVGELEAVCFKTWSLTPKIAKSDELIGFYKDLWHKSLIQSCIISVTFNYCDFNRRSFKWTG